jgi:hypothetical protein
MLNGYRFCYIIKEHGVSRSQVVIARCRIIPDKETKDENYLLSKQIDPFYRSKHKTKKHRMRLDYPIKPRKRRLTSFYFRRPISGGKYRSILTFHKASSIFGFQSQ